MDMVNTHIVEQYNGSYNYQVLLIDFTSLANGVSPSNLVDRLYYRSRSGSLWSVTNETLDEPRSFTKTYHNGDRAFSLCARRLWNNLPLALPKLNSIESFKRGLTAPFKNMRTLKFKVRPTMLSELCSTIWSDHRAFDSSRKLGGAAEHFWVRMSLKGAVKQTFFNSYSFFLKTFFYYCCFYYYYFIIIINHIPQRFLLPRIRISSGPVRERSFRSALYHIAFPWCPCGSDTVPWLVHSSSRKSRLRHTHTVCIQKNSHPVPSSQARWNANSVFI